MFSIMKSSISNDSLVHYENFLKRKKLYVCVCGGGGGVGVCVGWGCISAISKIGIKCLFTEIHRPTLLL